MSDSAREQRIEAMATRMRAVARMNPTNIDLWAITYVESQADSEPNDANFGRRVRELVEAYRRAIDSPGVQS